MGLFKDLAERGPATSAELASRMGLVERYTREWLNAMACAGYLHFNHFNQQFVLPKAHAPVLGREQAPDYLGGLYQSYQFIEKALFSKLIDAFKQGGGIDCADYDENYWEGQERYSALYYKHHLFQHYLPLLPRLRARLERGALVADVGCSGGSLIQLLAAAFPASRFVGFDTHAPSILQAQRKAEEAGVANRLSFICRDIEKGLLDTYDIILCFDVLHHVSDAENFLGVLHRALKSDGLLFCQEANCSERLDENFGPAGVMLYGTGFFCCVPQALAVHPDTPGPAGLPFPKMRALCQKAGFNHIQRIVVQAVDSAVYEISP